MSFVPSRVESRLKSVLVATDFSETYDKPLDVALAIARHYGAKLYLAHVVSSLGYMIGGPPGLAMALEGAEKEVQRLERDLIESGSLLGLDHEFMVRQGIVWKELQSIIVERQVDLVLLGTHGRHGIARLLLGSVAEQIFRHANCPVLTVGPNSYREAPLAGGSSFHFLFATDFGEASLHAFPYAVSLANQFKATLILLNVIPATPVPEGPGWYTAGDVMGMRDHARMASLRRLEQLRAGEEEPTVESEFMVQFGLPSEKILDIALKRKVDLIILGLHPAPHVAASSHVPWSTAYEVVCGAGCPVLTVRT